MQWLTSMGYYRTTTPTVTNTQTVTVTVTAVTVVRLTATTVIGGPVVKRDGTPTITALAVRGALATTTTAPGILATPLCLVGLILVGLLGTQISSACSCFVTANAIAPTTVTVIAGTEVQTMAVTATAL